MELPRSSVTKERERVDLWFGNELWIVGGKKELWNNKKETLNLKKKKKTEKLWDFGLKPNFWASRFRPKAQNKTSRMEGFLVLFHFKLSLWLLAKYRERIFVFPHFCSYGLARLADKWRYVGFGLLSSLFIIVVKLVCHFPLNVNCFVDWSFCFFFNISRDFIDFESETISKEIILMMGCCR